MSEILSMVSEFSDPLELLPVKKIILERLKNNKSCF